MQDNKMHKLKISIYKPIFTHNYFMVRALMIFKAMA
jgi:hypothetical protein